MCFAPRRNKRCLRTGVSFGAPSELTAPTMGTYVKLIILRFVHRDLAAIGAVGHAILAYQGTCRSDHASSQLRCFIWVLRQHGRKTAGRSSLTAFYFDGVHPRRHYCQAFWHLFFFFLRGSWWGRLSRFQLQFHGSNFDWCQAFTQLCRLRPAAPLSAVILQLAATR